MKQNILPAIKLTLVSLVVFCGLYSLLILGIAKAAPNKGEGQIWKTLTEDQKKEVYLSYKESEDDSNLISWDEVNKKAK